MVDLRPGLRSGKSLPPGSRGLPRSSAQDRKVELFDEHSSGHGWLGFLGEPYRSSASECRARGPHHRALAEARGKRSRLRGAGADPGGQLSFFAADLEQDDGWPEAVAGCHYVMHVASPMPLAAPKTEDGVIVPARDGALRVLKAARDAKVKRVVLTSTCGAIYYGHPPQKAAFDETSWTNIDGEMSAYVRSKAIAERAAWDFMAVEGGSKLRLGSAPTTSAESQRREPAEHWPPIRHGGGACRRAPAPVPSCRAIRPAVDSPTPGSVSARRPYPRLRPPSRSRVV